MLNLFRHDRKYFRSMRINPAPQIIYTLDKLENDYSTVRNFYTSRERGVENKNIISRLMHTMDLNVDLDIVSYVLSVDRQIGWVSRQFGFASTKSYGRLLDKDFYIIQDLYDDYFSFSDWRDITPIKPMATDYNRLTMDHPQHMIYTWSINYLDIRALAVQYYYWIREQYEYDRDTDIEVFVSQYPMTNMIQEYVNLSLIKLAFKDSGENHKNTHSIFVYNRTSELRAIFKKWRKRAKHKQIHVTDFLASIPLLKGSDGLEYIRTNLGPFNSYNFLPYFFLYGWYMKGMYDVVGKPLITANHTEFSDLNIMLRYYRSTRSESLDLGLVNDTKKMIYDFLLRLESRS